MVDISLLGFFTGGKDKDAENALKRAQDLLGGVKTPTAEQLTLPELQKQVVAGLMTPAEAQAALMQGNAYDKIKTDPKTLEAEMTALGSLQDIASSGGMTAEMQAQMTDALNQVKTQEQGQNASILDQFAQKGVPTSLLAGAMQSANAGQGAESANKAATDAAGNAEMNALTALQSSGQMAGQMHAQDYGEQSGKAAAANAINQWNAANTTGVNEANTQRRQASNAANVANAQDVSNTNTGLANQRTVYNAGVPQTVFNDAFEKASGQAGVANQQANLAQGQGQQNAGIWSGIINTATQFIPKAGGAGSMPTGSMQANGGTWNPKMTEGMLPAAHGAVVPGQPVVQGDSPKNDKVHAMLSPGEVVVPRSIAPHPDMVKNFVSHLMKNRPPVKPVHPDDIHSLVEALSRRREAQS